jgi:hypothetical protein
MSEQTRTYLCDLVPWKVKGGPWRLGRKHLGDQKKSVIVVDRKPYLYGIGQHAGHPYACVSFNLKQHFDVFRAGAAIHDSCNSSVSVELVVKGDGRILWRSRHFTGRRQVDYCCVSVTGIHILQMEACSRWQNTWDAHSVWLNPYVAKAGVSKVYLEEVIDETLDGRRVG